MTRYVFAALLSTMMPLPALAFCDPPIAPTLTSEKLAREFREEFRQDFETYFKNAEDYLRCLEIERSEIMVELRYMAARYNRFLNDSRKWETE